MRVQKPWLYLCFAGLAGSCGDGSQRGGAPTPSSTTDASTAGARSSDARAVGPALAPMPSAAGETTSDSSDAGSQTALPFDGGDAEAAGRDAEAAGHDAEAEASPLLDAGPTADSSRPPPTPAAGCLGGITDYGRRGKFTFTVATVQETYDSDALRLLMKVWLPVVPAGCKVPVVHWSNGTGASCASYAAILEHLASHGFLTTCYETTSSARSGGLPCFTALEAVYQKYPELADDKLGSAGHAQGGDAAHLCLQRAEAKWGTSKLYAGHAMAPESGASEPWQAAYAQIQSPMFLFNGTDDMLVSASWVNQAFEALADTTEAYWYEGQGATHIPIPVSWAQESAVVFFRWKLLGDKSACEYFKAMPTRMNWKLQKKQAEQGC